MNDQQEADRVTEGWLPKHRNETEMTRSAFAPKLGPYDGTARPSPRAANNYKLT